MSGLALCVRVSFVFILPILTGATTSVLELQAFVVELFSKFEFEFAGTVDDLRREACNNLMVPTLESTRATGSQLPVRIRMAPSDKA